MLWLVGWVPASADVGTLWMEEHTFVEGAVGLALSPSEQPPILGAWGVGVGLYQPVGRGGFAVELGAEGGGADRSAVVAGLRAGPTSGVLHPYAAARLGVGTPWPSVRAVGGAGLALGVGPMLAAVEIDAIRHGRTSMGQLSLRVGWGW